MDIALILNITAAKQAYDSQITSSNVVPDVFHDDPISNPFVVQFCVYNLLDTAYLDPLIAAWKAGVFVQVCSNCVLLFFCGADGATTRLDLNPMIS